MWIFIQHMFIECLLCVRYCLVARDMRRDRDRQRPLVCEFLMPELHGTHILAGSRCSVTKSCLTLCDPMDCSTPGFPVFHCLPKFAQTHVHWVDDAIQPSHPLLPPSPPAFRSFPASGSFPMNRFLASGGQSIGASALASVLQMNIQGWFPLG